MTLDELRTHFGTPDGIFYRIHKNKTPMEILTDLNQSISTYSDATGNYILVAVDFDHEDYSKVV